VLRWSQRRPIGVLLGRLDLGLRFDLAKFQLVVPQRAVEARLAREFGRDGELGEVLLRGVGCGDDP